MKAVIKGTSYTLVHAPDMLKLYGSQQVAAINHNPQDEYLKNIPKHLRSFEDFVNYVPNQIYVGNKRPEFLLDVQEPWYNNSPKGSTEGKYGDIISQEEFYLLIKYADVFELVAFTEEFASKAKNIMEKSAVLKNIHIVIGDGEKSSEIESLIKAHTAVGLYINDGLVGCVKQAHDTDPNLNAHVMIENLSTKASGIFSALALTKQGGDLSQVEYIIECSEEACGDVNQRGGGNIAKSIGEKVGCNNASGIDLRGFCAAPVHAMVSAAAYVNAGIYKSVLVVAGGSVPKLGMNGRDHVKKEMPILEDAIAGFAFLVTSDDGVSPVINTQVVGKHNISSGSSPQAVTTSLVYDPLHRNGFKLADVQKYSAELHNPEITKPAGAGNVPESNYKMIAALAVMKSELEKADLPKFVAEHGLPGFAPTQGHVPSGVPYLGHARDAMLAGELKNALIVGKGSLFLGRLTNLFDGMSFLIEANTGEGEQETQSEGAIKKVVAEAMGAVAEQLRAQADKE